MRNKRLLLWVSGSTILIGCIVIIGWLLNIPVLESVVPGYATMKFNTALSFIITGITLYLTVAGKYDNIRLTLLALLFLLTAGTLVQDIFNYNLGIDQLFFPDKNSIAAGVSFPGRMSTATALCFNLLAIALVLINSKSFKNQGQYLLHLISLVTFIAIVGYLFKIPAFYKMSFLTSMAVHTALFLFAISVAVSLLNDHLGVTGLFTQDKIGSRTARRLFPRMAITVLVLGFLRIEASRYHLVSLEFGMALFTIAFILVGLLMTLEAAKSLNKIDSQRAAAERYVMETNTNLEILIAQRNSELRAILDSALVSIIGADSDGLITHFNKGAEVLLGYPAGEVIGRQTPAFIHLPEEVARRGEELSIQYNREIKGNDIFTEPARLGDYESRKWTYVRKNGSTFPVQLVVTPIVANNKNVLGYLGIATDITQLTKIQTDLDLLAQQLKQQNDKLLNFAHITSHNLRSPVSNLNSLLFLYDESDSEDEKTMLFTKFEKVAGHLTTILNDLVESLKIQEDHSKDREPLVFEEMFEKTKQILAGQIIETKAVVTADFSKADMINYPRVYLESIMLNLFSNAIKYRSAERVPRIHFQTEKVNDEVILTASDNGIGLDLKKHGNDLFGLNKTFHTNAEAKGVGLFIVKTQVEAMGGAISAESEVNQGTTFKIVFNKT